MRVELADALLVAGFVALLAGLWLVHPALTLGVGGALLMAAGWRLATAEIEKGKADGTGDKAG